MPTDADGVAGTAAVSLAFEVPIALDRLGDGRAFLFNVLVVGSGTKDEDTGISASVASGDGVSFN